MTLAQQVAELERRLADWESMDVREFLAQKGIRTVTVPVLLGPDESVYVVEVDRIGWRSTPTPEQVIRGIVPPTVVTLPPVDWVECEACHGKGTTGGTTTQANDLEWSCSACCPLAPRSTRPGSLAGWGVSKDARPGWVPAPTHVHDFGRRAATVNCLSCGQRNPEVPTADVNEGSIPRFTAGAVIDGPALLRHIADDYRPSPEFLESMVDLASRSDMPELRDAAGWHHVVFAEDGRMLATVSTWLPRTRPPLEWEAARPMPLHRPAPAGQGAPGLLPQRAEELVLADAVKAAATDRWQRAVMAVYDADGEDRPTRWREYDVKLAVHEAVHRLTHEPVEALVRVLDDDGRRLAARNRADRAADPAATPDETDPPAPDAGQIVQPNPTES